MAEALASRDMGRVSYAYRRHAEPGRVLSQAELAHRIGVTQGQVSRIERGDNRVTSLDRLAAWATALGIPPGLLWFDLPHEPDASPAPGRVSTVDGLPPTTDTEDDPVKRRQFLAGALATTGLAALDHTTAEATQLVRLPTASYRQLDAATPARHLIGPVRAHLTLARRMAATDSPTLHAATSEAAGLAAWLYADLGDHAQAREHYRLAIHYAGRSAHPLLIPYMTASLGQYAADSGDPHQGLALIRKARAQMPQRAPGTAWAWLTSLEAVALAGIGDKAALGLLDAAERRAARHGETEWPWVFTFDTAKVTTYRATATAHLGMTRAASEAFTESAPTAPKQYALALIDQAGAHAKSGDISTSCQFAITAFDIGQRYDSERVMRRVTEFRAQLPPSADATALDDRLAEMYD